MLAYVFWHWPEDGAGADGYETSLKRFHRALADHAPEGFIASAAFRIAGAPWVCARESAYEDWYLAGDFCALGSLNEAAASVPRTDAHGEVAAKAGGGTDSVYRSDVADAGTLAAARHAVWLSKPQGMTSPQFMTALAPWMPQPGAILWQRQMAPGPASEFCLQTADPHELPAEFTPVNLELTPVEAGKR